MIKDIEGAKAYVLAHPECVNVSVTKEALNFIREQIEESTVTKRSPRPTYGPPWGNVDRFFWDQSEYNRKRCPVYILGKPLVVVE